MRFLLTSSGIKNASIHDALVDLLGKPIGESNALCIPTGVLALPRRTVHTSTGSSADQPPAPCANWVGSRWECWS